jgi:hypothetical protein
VARALISGGVAYWIAFFATPTGDPFTMMVFGGLAALITCPAIWIVFRTGRFDAWSKLKQWLLASGATVLCVTALYWILFSHFP